MQATGVDVEIATTHDGHEGASADSSADSNLKWRHFRRSTDRYKVSLPFVVWLLQRVREYDLLHIHALFSFTSVVAAWAARRAGVPYVIRPLGVLSNYGMLERRRELKRLSFRFVEGPLLRDAAVVHFTSEAERAEAESLGVPMRSVVIPLALPEEALRADVIDLSSRLGERLVFLSRLDPKKNVESLLDAFAQVAASRPQAMLAIAGAGDPAYVETLRARARSLGLAARVDWLGDVRGDAKASLLRGGAVFVLPSHSENFGIAVAEALAAGLPCAVSRGVALATVVEQSGAGVVTGTDAASIAAGIETVLADPARRMQMARAGVAKAQREFSSAVMGRRLRALYEEILARPRP